jgi:hypothetical protein
MYTQTSLVGIGKKFRDSVQRLLITNDPNFNFYVVQDCTVSSGMWSLKTYINISGFISGQ